MFGPPGRAYVYLIYGVHWCLNVVTGAEGTAQAVLIRGMQPVEGLAAMRRRRGRDSDLGNGPGRLAASLGVTGDLYGHDLGSPPLRVLAGEAVLDRDVTVTGRIGVTAAADWPLRFLVEPVRGAP
jgi:DNA-3-methyladenine glycosylase